MNRRKYAFTFFHDGKSVTTKLELTLHNGIYLFVYDIDAFLNQVTDNGRLSKQHFLRQFIGTIRVPFTDNHVAYLFDRCEQNASYATLYKVISIKELVHAWELFQFFSFFTTFRVL